MMRHGFLTLACGLAIGLTIPGYSGTPNPGQPNQAPAAPGNLAPAAAVKNFLDLVHAGKYAAASAVVADLLATYPHDLRLPRAKELVDKAIAAETIQPVGAAAGKPTKADLEASRRLVELAEQAKKTSDPARQKALLRQFMNESGPFVEMHPGQQQLWEIRAAAALVLNDPMAGYEAGWKLQALGAEGSTDRNLLQLLALLRAKGWQDERLVGQAVEAATFTPGKGHTTMLTDDLTMDFAWIPPGKFTMGSPQSEPGRSYNEGPQTPVTISRGFWLGRTPVTQIQYQALIGDSPNYYKEAGPNSPVSHIEWGDARDFCRRLTEREREAGRLPAGYIYRLPTEAEWEYACRAGTAGSRYAEDLDAIAWNSDNNRSGVYQPVGEKRPNAWGLHDMFGGGWEWCLDQYGPYAGVPVTDPRGADSGKGHVYRGTYPYENPGNCRAAKRNGSAHSYAYSGFRVAISVGGPGQ